MTSNFLLKNIAWIWLGNSTGDYCSCSDHNKVNKYNATGISKYYVPLTDLSKPCNII